MQVPTISLQSFFEAEADCSDLEELSSNLRVLDLASQLRAACEEVGFFVVTEHGVSKDLMEGFRQECTAFFRRSPQSNAEHGVRSGQPLRLAGLCPCRV